MLQGRFFRRIVELKSGLDREPSLPFSEVLSRQRITAVLKELKALYRDRLYPPWATLWIFLSQVLSADHSCREALSRWLAFRAARGLGPCSTDTGGYCQARKRLPLALLMRLARDTGRELHQQAPHEWRIAGRSVKLVDGSTVSMPDTPDNVAAFGKPRNQHGVSPFPVARLVAVLCLATGAALESLFVDRMIQSPFTVARSPKSALPGPWYTSPTRHSRPENQPESSGAESGGVTARVRGAPPGRAAVRQGCGRGAGIFPVCSVFHSIAGGCSPARMARLASSSARRISAATNWRGNSSEASRPSVSSTDGSSRYF